MYAKLTLTELRQAIPNHGRHWDDRDRDYLIRQVNKGRPITEIAHDMGRSINSVIFAMDSLGLNPDDSLMQSYNDVRAFVNSVIIH